MPCRGNILPALIPCISHRPPLPRRRVHFTKLLVRLLPRRQLPSAVQNADASPCRAGGDILPALIPCISHRPPTAMPPDLFRRAEWKCIFALCRGEFFPSVSLRISHCYATGFISLCRRLSGCNGRASFYRSEHALLIVCPLSCRRSHFAEKNGDALLDCDGEFHPVLSLFVSRRLFAAM